MFYVPPVLHLLAVVSIPMELPALLINMPHVDKSPVNSRWGADRISGLDLAGLS